MFNNIHKIIKHISKKQIKNINNDLQDIINNLLWNVLGNDYGVAMRPIKLDLHINNNLMNAFFESYLIKSFKLELFIEGDNGKKMRNYLSTLEIKDENYITFLSYGKKPLLIQLIKRMRNSFAHGGFLICGKRIMLFDGAIDLMTSFIQFSNYKILEKLNKVFAKPIEELNKTLKIIIKKVVINQDYIVVEMLKDEKVFDVFIHERARKLKSIAKIHKKVLELLSENDKEYIFVLDARYNYSYNALNTSDIPNNIMILTKNLLVDFLLDKEIKNERNE